MLKQTLFIITASLALLALGSCGTSNLGTGAPVLDGTGHAVAGFQLDVMPETYGFGGSADGFALAANPELSTDSHLVVDINVTDAQNLKSLYLRLQYDAAHYRAMVVEPTTLMGDKSELLKIMALEGPGIMQYGQTLPHQDLQVGFSGSGTVAQISFRREAEPMVKAVLVAPGPSPFSRVSDLSFNGVDTLTWSFASQGDYDQNGEVNAADLARIAQNLNEVSPGGLGTPFPYNTAESQIDGGNDGLINGSDLTPIGQNLRKSCLGGFHVFKSASAADAPAAPFIGPNGAGAVELGIVQVADAVNLAQGSTQRLSFSFTIAAPAPNDFYWVRAFDEAGAAGIASNVAGGNPAALPALSLVTAAQSGSGTQADPYVFLDTTDYTFQLLDTPGGADVSTDPNTVFSVTPATAGTFAQNVLNVTDALVGDFLVTATYNGVQNHSSSDIYVHVGTIPGGNAPVIDKDPADADWAGVTGTGADDANAYILHTSTFNPDTDSDGVYELVFSLQALDGAGGPVIPNANLDWDAFPPFCVADPNAFTQDATAGTFQAWTFTSGYLFAQDPAQPGAPGKSNDLYVAVQSLPN
jgi:hypothetical protein